MAKVAKRTPTKKPTPKKVTKKIAKKASAPKKVTVAKKGKSLTIVQKAKSDA